MSTSRLEAFSDGVLAIIITIMVLELRVPDEPTWHGLTAVFPTFLSYLLSFVYVGIYWNNHHHMIKLTESVTGGILWANLHLLFWLSMVPFTTRWMDESGFAEVPVFIYGLNLLANAVAYVILQTLITRHQGPGDRLSRALGNDWKGKASPAIYIAGALGSLAVPVLGLAAYTAVAVIWLVPDRRLERAITQTGGD